MSRLIANGLTVGYGDEPVLRDVSFDMELGGSIVLLGENGSGKTTLLRTLCGLLPYEGNLTLDGREIRDYRREELSRRVSLLSQFSDAYFSYTVRETVMLGRYLELGGFLGRPTARDEEYVTECMRAVGIEEYADRRTDELSGGQRQRVFLARTLAQGTDIIALDEPTNHLDMRYTAQLTEYLSDWVNRGKKHHLTESGSQGAEVSGRNGAGIGIMPHTLIGVFHDITLALRLADRCILLRNGRVMRTAIAAELLSHSEWLDEIYGLDVAGYLREQGEIWK